MKKYLTELGEEGSSTTIMYIDMGMELIGKVPQREFDEMDRLRGNHNYSKITEKLDCYNEDFRPCLYEKLSDAGKMLVDSALKGGDNMFVLNDKLDKLKEDDKYIREVWDIPFFKKKSHGGIQVNENAIRRIGFPIGYSLKQELATPMDYAHANILYELKPKDELVAEMTDVVAKTAGLKKGFETLVAENVIENKMGSYSPNYSFKDALHDERVSNEAGCASGLTYYYETLMIYDKYDKDIQEIQGQMVREGINPYGHSEDPDDVKDHEVKKAYAYVLQKIARSEKQIENELDNVRPYRAKQYGIAKEILHEFGRENEHTMTLGR